MLTANQKKLTPITTYAPEQLTMVSSLTPVLKALKLN